MGVYQEDVKAQIMGLLCKVVVSLRPSRTLMKRLRNINLNVNIFLDIQGIPHENIKSSRGKNWPSKTLGGLKNVLISFNISPVFFL